MPETAILITELNAGGAEQVVFDLATGMQHTRPVVLALDGRGVFADRLRHAKVEVHDLGARSCRDLSVLFRLRRWLRERRPNLLHTHLLHATVLGRLAAWGTGIPVLSTCHIVERRPRAWHFVLNRWTARLGVGEVCVSEAVRRFQIEKTRLPAPFFHVIHNGIDLARFHTPAEKADACRIRSRAALGLEPDAFWFGFLGRFTPQKGADILLQAMGDPGLTEACLVLGGYGEEEEALREQATGLGLAERIRFAGYQANPADFFRACDAVVMPSRWEGFGLVAVEALAAGCPLVATRVDALPEILDEGKTALLVVPEDPDSLAEAMRRVLGDAELRARLSCAGRRRAADFSRSRMVAAYEALYDRFLPLLDAE